MSKIVEVKMVEVAPELAHEFLSRAAVNRNLRMRKVNQYAADMKSGRWDLNGETIKFNTDGELIDGQHRLHAVISAGRPVSVLVAYNINKKAMPTIDSGAARPLGAQLQIDGKKNANALAASTQMLMANGAEGYWSNQAKRRFTNHEVFSYLRANPHIETLVADGLKYGDMLALLGAKVWLFIYVTTIRAHEKEARYFWDTIENSISFSGSDDPAYVLKRRLENLKLTRVKDGVGLSHTSRTILTALCIKAFNAYLKGEKMSKVNYNATETPPTLNT